MRKPVQCQYFSCSEVRCLFFLFLPFKASQWQGKEEGHSDISLASPVLLYNRQLYRTGSGFLAPLMPHIAGALWCSRDLLLHHPMSPVSVSALTPVSPTGPGHRLRQRHVCVSGFPVRFGLMVTSLSRKGDGQVLWRQHRPEAVPKR